MASKTDGKIILKTEVDQSGVKNGINSIKQGFNGLSGAIQKLKIAIGIGLGIRELVQFGKTAVEIASDLQEVQNVVDVAFGSMKQKMEDFADTALKTYGISKLTAKRTGSTYMAMAKGMGIADETASEMALTLTGLTGDVASFYNLSQERADTVLKSVFTGETESLKQLGIVMTEVNLQNFAHTKGIKKKLSAMSQEEKTMLRYRFVLEQTKLAQGDFLNTQDSWANQTRIMAESWKEMQVVWGETFIALGTLFLPTINRIIEALAQAGQVAQKTAQAIYKAFTGKTLEIKAADNQADSIADSVDNQNDLTDAISKTNEEQKKSMLGFDELNTLSEKTAETTADIGGLGGIDMSDGGLSFAESEEDAFDLSKYDELTERLQGIAVLVASVGTSLLAWKITTLLLSNLDKISMIFKSISGWALIIGGALLTLEGYSDAWANGIDWHNLSETFAGIALTIMGIAIAVSPVAAAFSAIGFGVSLVALAFKDMKENGVNVMNVLTAISGVLLAIFGTLALMGKISVFGTLLPLLGLIAGAFMTIKGATDAWVNGVDWGNLALMIGGVAVAITAIGVSSNLAYTGIALIVSGIALFVIGLHDIINNGANAKNTILLLAGAVATAIGIVITMSKALGTSLTPSAMIAAVAFGALTAGIIAVISQWNNMSSGERIASVLGLITVAAIGAAIAFGALQSAWSLGLAAAGIIAGIVAITASVERASSRAESLAGGYDADALSSYAQDFTANLPHLAKGAVIPPNKEFLAVLGDQKSGTNIEAPLDTIKQAFRDELQNMGGVQSETVTNINFTGNLAQLARILKPQIERETLRQGTKLITGGSY